MPILRTILATAELAGSIDHAGASLIYGPDYATVLAALLATPADAASSPVRRSVSPLRAVATRAPRQPPASGGETGRASGSPRQAALRAVADSRPVVRSAAAPALQRGDIAKARAGLRRDRFGGGHGGVAPAAMDRGAADGAVTAVAGRGTLRRPATLAGWSGIGPGRVADPGDGGGAARGATACPPATAEPRRANYRPPADPRADLSPEPAEARSEALRAAALARGATIVEDGPPSPAASTGRVTDLLTGRNGERVVDPVAGAAPLATVSAPIAPPARHSPAAAGAHSPRRSEPAPRSALSPPAVRHGPAKLDDSGTVLAEAAWRNGVDSA